MHGHNDESIATTIVAMERAALDRWGKGDPDGYLEISADDASYFDPYIEARIDGLRRVREHYAPFVGAIRVDRYDLVSPAVVAGGVLAMLTFNLVNFVWRDGVETILNRWNCTEVYRLDAGTWRIVHSHWSLVLPLQQT